MATFKAVVLKHRKREDGTYNIKIRVIHNRSIKYISTNLYCQQSDLKKSFELKNISFIETTNDIIKKYRDICNTNSDRLDNISIQQLVELITKQQNGFNLNFIEFARLEDIKLKNEGRAGTGRQFSILANSLIRFIGSEYLSINDITSKFIDKYIQWLITEPAQIREGHKLHSQKAKGDRKQSLYPSVMRNLHNRAKAIHNDEDLGLINIPLSPFKKIAIPKVSISRKRALDIDSIKKIIQLPYSNGKGVATDEFCRYNLAKDMFILSFGLVGMNSADLYNCTDYHDGYITYNRTKTKGRRADKAYIKIKVQPEMIDLVEKYIDPTKNKTFSFHQHYKNSVTFNVAINKGLKIIGEDLEIDDLEFYAARHSWATIALNDCKIDKYTVHSALNHVDEAMKVTDIYIKKDFGVIDEANRKVLDAIK